MSGVGDEPALAVQGLLQAGEQRVDGGAQFRDLVSGGGDTEAPVEVAVADLRGLAPHPLDGPQRRPGQQPRANPGQQHRHRCPEQQGQLDPLDGHVGDQGPGSHRHDDRGAGARRGRGQDAMRSAPICAVNDVSPPRACRRWVSVSHAAVPADDDSTRPSAATTWISVPGPTGSGSPAPRSSATSASWARSPGSSDASTLTCSCATKASPAIVRATAVASANSSDNRIRNGIRAPPLSRSGHGGSGFGGQDALLPVSAVTGGRA